MHQSTIGIGDDWWLSSWPLRKRKMACGLAFSMVERSVVGLMVAEQLLMKMKVVHAMVDG